MEPSEGRGGSGTMLPRRAPLPILLALLLAPLASAEPVVVVPTGDAQADAVAASGTGDARSTCRSFGTIPCATVSVFGNASNGNRVEVMRLRACVAPGLSGLCPVNGSADAADMAEVDPSDDADGTVAVAPQGHSSGVVAAGASSEGLAALATGDARGVVAVGGGSARGYVAISVAGEAESEGCLTTPVDPCHRGVAIDGSP